MKVLILKKTLKKIKLGDHIKYISDYHANGSYENLKKNIQFKTKSDFAIVIRTLNFERQDFKDDLLYINKKEYDFLSKSKVRMNDILMNKIANPGSIYLMPQLKKPVSCGMNLFLIRFDDSLNQVYMYYNMKNSEPYIKSFSHGTTTKTVTKEDVRNIKLSVHSRNEQDKIAQLLQSIDLQISNNKTIIDKNMDLCTTIFNRWFLQYDFPDSNGNPYKQVGGMFSFNSQIKRKIPLGWTVAELGSIIIENKKSKIKVKDVKNYGEIPFFTSGNNILWETKQLATGMNCYLNTGGNAGIHCYMGKASYSTDTWSITAKDGLEFVLPFFLKNMLPSMDTIFFQGTGLKHLQKGLLKKYKLCLPPSKLVSRFSEIASVCFEQEHQLIKKNKKLTELRELLLPMLMNGQLSIN